MVDSGGCFAAAYSQGGHALTARSTTYRYLVLFITLVFALSATSVFAVPASKAQQAAEAKERIDRLGTQVEVAAEAYNNARIKHAQLVEQVKTQETRVAEANARIDSLQGDLNARAWSMYRNGPVTFLEVLLQAEDFDEFASTWDVLHNLNENDAKAVIELRTARQEAEAARQDLAAKEQEAAGQVKVMADKKRSIEKQLAEQKRLRAGLEAEIAALKAAEDAREAERARAAAAAAARVSFADFEVKFPPPTRGARSEVVSIAKRYLGAPYPWGADGPNSFDCSGFTMFVYRQVGVSLPHSSSAQFSSGDRVSRDDLEPGDLVFFGSPIHHVGIYVGGGAYIHAPNSGDVVKISALDRSDYRGAVRP